MTVTRLTIDDSGTWLLVTESGRCYQLDLDEMTVRRDDHEGVVEPQLAVHGIIEVPTRLLSFLDVEIGAVAQLLVHSELANFVSMIDTRSPVAEIRRLL